MKKISILLSFVLIAQFAIAQINPKAFVMVDDLLKQRVENGLVDYKTISNNDPVFLDAKLTILFQNVPDTITPATKAFYLNAYNVLVLQGVSENYPIKSPMDVDGFFNEKQYRLGKEKITLNQLENDIIRPKYKDARIHFGLVCGALGCPKLTNEAFTPENVESKLEKLTVAAINDDNFIKVDDKKKVAKISEIFKWYKQDFLDDAGSVMAYLNKYRTTKIPADYKIDYYTYDWTLNAQ